MVKTSKKIPGKNAAMYRTSDAPDPMEHLADLLKRKKAEVDERKQREKVVLLQYRLKCLKEKKEKQTAQLAKSSNVPHSPSSYFRVVHGVRVEARPNDSIAVVFSPVAKVADKARMAGPYEVVLKKAGSSDQVRLHSYVLPVPGDQEMTPGERHFADDPKAPKQPQPAAYLEHKRRKKNGGHHVIPIDQLASDHLSPVDEGQVDTFAQSVSALLSAYVRRMCQVADMIGRFNEEVDQVDVSRTVDRVSFVLRLQVGEDEDENELKFHVTLKYDPDKIRPRQGSLRVNFLGDDTIEDALKESLEEQCLEFYSRDLADAIDKAFH